MRFWDSSALVPLVVRQPSSRLAESWLVDDGEMVLWTLTEVEIISALRRLVRQGTLTEARAAVAEEVAVGWVTRAHVVTEVQGVKTTARRLLRLHDLRAADALQLAAALLWAGRPAGRVLHSFDRRLGLAAAREGFTVVPAVPP